MNLCCDQIVGDGDNDRRTVLDDSDLSTVSEKLKLVSIEEETVTDTAKQSKELLKSDEELARMLQVFIYFVFFNGVKC